VVEAHAIRLDTQIPTAEVAGLYPDCTGKERRGITPKTTQMPTAEVAGLCPDCTGKGRRGITPKTEYDTPTWPATSSTSTASSHSSLAVISGMDIECAKHLADFLRTLAAFSNVTTCERLYNDELIDFI
jgi:hypothetical protein